MLGTLNAITNTVMLVFNAAFALTLVAAVAFYRQFREAADRSLRSLNVPEKVDLVPSRRMLLLLATFFAANALLYNHSARCNMRR